MPKKEKRKKKERILPKAQKQIPQFDPEYDDVEEWTEKVDAVRRIYCWTRQTTTHSH